MGSGSRLLCGMNAWLKRGRLGLQVRGYPCDCQWPEHCDSQQGGLPPTRMASKAPATSPAQPSSHAHSAQPEVTCSSDQAGSNGHPDQGGATSELPAIRPEDRQAPNATEQSMQRHVGNAEASSAEAASADRPTEACQQPGQLLGHGAEQAKLQRLEQEFVHDVYNAIAMHFSATRFAVWPKVCPKCLYRLTLSACLAQYLHISLPTAVATVV